MVLLFMTACLFPLQFLTLELPKRIINDAIDAEQDFIDVLNYEMTQENFLIMLSLLFLLTVLGHGLMKMRINTMKGVLSERMLRRYRFSLISRITRFPQPYLRRTSQGELVSMITAESEPLGGMMGDAISLPVMQAGQMLTILTFLFLQNVWFGLAAIALIPLQAWLIPKLQRQINLLNKDRIQQVRHLAAEIGETATGTPELRGNGGWRFRMAQITRRLGTLFLIRLNIYKKKFFMKFLNNFITQLTPFFFYLVGGLLVIRGQVTLGALVAALAAYKDLSSPWKELLNYYNRVSDLSVRWHLIGDRFEPSGMVDEALLEDEPKTIPRLSGEIVLNEVFVRDHDGDSVLENITATIPQGTVLGIRSQDAEERRAIAELFTREITPVSGNLSIGGLRVNDLHQRVIATRVGYADPAPYVFAGTFGDNVLMPLKRQPLVDLPDPMGAAEEKKRAYESVRTGNSSDRLYSDWLDPYLADMASEDAVHDWWVRLMDATGAGSALFRRGLDQPFTETEHPELAHTIVSLRPKVRNALAAAGLDKAYYRFDPELYNPALPVASNLFFATLRTDAQDPETGGVGAFLDLLHELGIEDGILRMSREVIEMLNQTFGMDGTDHPLFQQLGLSVDTFSRNVELARKSRDVGLAQMERSELEQMIELPFEVSAERIGPGFGDDLKETILSLRHNEAEKLSEWLSAYFTPLREDRFASGLTVLENAIYGKLTAAAGPRGEQLRDIVAQTLTEADVKKDVAELLFAVPTGIGGAGLPGAFAEPLAISRAAIKKPDILILNRCLAAYEEGQAADTVANLRALLPETTMIFLEEDFEDADSFDMVLELEHGRLKDGKATSFEDTGNAASADLRRKMRALTSADMFAGVSRRQMRLLAFGAQWHQASEGDYVFHMGDDPSDGAYLILEGQAGLGYRTEDGKRHLVAEAGPGTLVGELALIRKEKRALDMYAKTDLEMLRLGESEFMAVIENDAPTAFRILQAVSGYVGAPKQSSGDS
ncbi:cyclic nucleotide-binding domain-containing protein [Shimia marina]|uniref:Putative multidrug resistance ABC transporter ATP-binding/permease protein YheH n=1 Tax=Shimia marina TaxID=321267 RepID=A0A0P1ER09_9RHOB|nr:cyclic nucleotide-binding domain-containing protein [Shimia marina]CUH52197.1 putative multidrug resistance ABC transporter ATP-binding/permease protein YheH [Shimia marina]SFE73460.1 ABC-type multidrug transport system, ATPase and permease component [Shimia marina]